MKPESSIEYRTFREAADAARAEAKNSGCRVHVIRSSTGYLISHPAPEAGLRKSVQIKPEDPVVGRLVALKESLSPDDPRRRQLVRDLRVKGKKNKLRAANNTFKFVLSMEALEFRSMTIPELTDQAREMFPEGSIRSEIEVRPVPGSYGGMREDRYLSLTVRDESLSKPKFDELINYFAEDLKILRIL